MVKSVNFVSFCYFELLSINSRSTVTLSPAHTACTDSFFDFFRLSDFYSSQYFCLDVDVHSCHIDTFRVNANDVSMCQSSHGFHTVCLSVCLSVLRHDILV